MRTIPTGQIHEQHGKVKAWLANRAIDGVRQAVQKELPVGKSGEQIRDRGTCDVLVRAHHADRLSVGSSDNQAAARHPPVRAAFVAQTVLKCELRRARDTRGLYFNRDLTESSG